MCCIYDMMYDLCRKLVLEDNFFNVVKDFCNFFFLNMDVVNMCWRFCVYLSVMDYVKLNFLVVWICFFLFIGVEGM